MTDEPGRSRRLRAAIGVGALVGLGVGLTAAANLVVVWRARAGMVDRVADLRPAQVAIVPGSLVRSDGSLGAVVEERVATAVELYGAGLVKKVLMSGDNGSADYDEPGAMRDAAVAAGVPAEDVFTDYAGFNTWHTMSRAADVFDVRSAIVVSQAPYLARAVDLARAAGLDVQGLSIGAGGRIAREVVARVRGLAQATARPPVVGGPAIPIDGDGRRSWA